jgi:hypothetical protein
MFRIALLLSASSEHHIITRHLSYAGKARGNFDEVLRKLRNYAGNPPIPKRLSRKG